MYLKMNLKRTVSESSQSLTTGWLFFCFFFNWCINLCCITCAVEMFRTHLYSRMKKKLKIDPHTQEIWLIFCCIWSQKIGYPTLPLLFSAWAQTIPTPRKKLFAIALTQKIWKIGQFRSADKLSIQTWLWMLFALLAVPNRERLKKLSKNVF